MWLVYALSASIIWGISYASSGRVIERGVSPLVFFTLYAATGTVMGVAALTAMGKLNAFPDELRGLGRDWTWLAVSVVTSGIGALLIYTAISAKNATLASLIEITYPLFVAFFAWAFFRDTQFNIATVAGAVLIMSGVGVVFLGNRG